MVVYRRRALPMPSHVDRLLTTVDAFAEEAVAFTSALARIPTINPPGDDSDHKHVARIAGISNCVAYGPGRLELAHQPDEYCEIADLVTTTKVLALAVLELTGTA